jgi:hypothetical protein
LRRKTLDVVEAVFSDLGFTSPSALAVIKVEKGATGIGHGSG